VAAAQGGVLGLEAPGDEGGESSGFFLQIVEALKVVDAVSVVLSHSEHHGRRGPHADLVGRAVDVDPVFGEALEAGDLVADLIVEDFSAAAGNRVQAGIAQAQDGVADRQAARLGDGDNLRRRVAMQMHPRKSFPDAAEHLLVPVDFEVGMQPSLHQHAGAAEFDGFTNLVVDGVEIEDVAFLCSRALQRTIKRAEGAVLGAEVGVVDVAVDDVGDHAFRVQATANGVGFHAYADQVIGVEHLESLHFAQGHTSSTELTILAEWMRSLQAGCGFQCFRIGRR